MTEEQRAALVAAADFIQGDGAELDMDEAKRIAEMLRTLAEPAEPVASLMTNVQSGDVEVVWNDDGFDREMWHETPLYTSPPQRKPLTDDQLDDIAVAARRGNLYDLRIAIEKAHGIGGSDE